MTTLSLRLSLAGAQGRTDTKEAFWYEYVRLSGYESSRLDESHPDFLEGHVFSSFQARLNRAVKRHFSDTHWKEFRESPALIDPDIQRLTLRVVRVEYSSLDVLIEILGLNNGALLPLVAAALEIYAPEELSGALPGSHVAFRSSVRFVDWPKEAHPIKEALVPAPPNALLEANGPLGSLRRIWQIANLSLLLPVLLSLGVLYLTFASLGENEKEIAREREHLRNQASMLINATIERNKVLESTLKDVLGSASQVIREAHRFESEIMKERATSRKSLSDEATIPR